MKWFVIFLLLMGRNMNKVNKCVCIILLLAVAGCGKKAEPDPLEVAAQQAQLDRVKLKDWTCSDVELTRAKSYFETCNKTQYLSSHCWDSAVSSSCTKRAE